LDKRHGCGGKVEVARGSEGCCGSKCCEGKRRVRNKNCTGLNNVERMDKNGITHAG